MSFFRRLFGGEASAHYRTGMRAFDAGEYEQALRCFQRVLEAGAPRCDPIAHLATFYAAEAALHLGRAALQAGEPAAALGWFEPALRGTAVSPALLETAALAYLETGGEEAALACLQALLRVDPLRLDAHWMAALVHHARGDAVRAAQHLQAVRAQAVSAQLSPRLYRILEARAANFPDLAALLRDFVPSPQSSRV